MGSFQINYDDFSGGQYMGDRAGDWPKNQWNGTNVLSTPNGGLISTELANASTYVIPFLHDSLKIYDHWVISTDSYAFVTFIRNSTSTTTSRLVKTSGVNDGTTFPITSVGYPLTGILNGNVSYYPSTSLFYYISTAGNIYSVTTSGTVTLVSAALASLDLTNITSYGYRLLAWGGTNATGKKRLYYSDTTLSTWSTADYYEFNGTILNVLPRTNDLLVICDTGVFSLVGVLGSSITSQLIVSQENITEGMKDATIVGRSAFFLDQLNNGSLDGRVYQLNGANVAVNQILRIEDTTAQSGLEQGRVMAVNDGRITIFMRSGICYAETTRGQWCRLFPSDSFTTFIDLDQTKQIQVARPGPNSLNEYFCVALYNKTYKALGIGRYLHNTIVPTPVNANMGTSGSGGGGGTTYPTGTVELAEYWHSKPFTVKEMFVEYSPVNDTLATPIVTASIKPTGNVDVLASNMTNMISSSESNISQSTAYPNTYVFERFRPNNANKGYGVIPKLSFSAVTIKRVILNCED